MSTIISFTIPSEVTGFVAQQAGAESGRFWHCRWFGITQIRGISFIMTPTQCLMICGLPVRFHGKLTLTK